MAVSAPAEGSLELADATRRGTRNATAFELWQAAAEESHGAQKAREERFRHAMIHAGYLLTARGLRYKRCSVCRGILSA